MTPKKRGSGIVKLSKLFEKYQKTLKPPQGSVIATCIEVIEGLCGYTLKKEQCVYKPQSRTLSIQVTGIVKTEIILKKKEILKLTQEKLGEFNAPKDIL